MLLKSWFFEVESELEFNDSCKMCYEQLTNDDTKILPFHLFDAIRTWICANLDPYITMWLNYSCLNVGGMNARTTSVGEPLYTSMKLGYDEIRASISTDVSANKMINKAKKG